MVIPTEYGRSALLEGTKSVSASEQAYGLLKDLIVRSELPPGAVLNEGLLMEKLNLGRTPLREALQRLAQDHLVVILPRRGILVSDISIADLQAIFEVRADLEGLCGRLAAQRISEDQLSRLEGLFTGMEAGGDEGGDVEIDQQFHRLLIEAADNRYLTDMLSRLHCLSLRLLYLTKSRMATVREDYDDYWTVINALKRRDAAAVEEALRQHAFAFHESVRQTFSP